MTVVTPAVCLQALSGGTGGAKGEGTRENDTLSGLRGPQHRAKTGPREASRKRPVGSVPWHSPSPTLSIPQVGGGLEVGTGQAGRRLGRDPSLGFGSLPQPGGGGGWAPRPREAILAAGPPKDPAALHVPTPRPSLPPAPTGGRSPPRGQTGRGGAGEAPAPGPRRAGALGRRAGAGAGASCRRDPGGRASRGKEGRERGAVTYTGPQPPPPPPRCG